VRIACSQKKKEEPKKIDKNAKYTKEDFIANKHGKEREPWVQGRRTLQQVL
jgi:hypothetical protein